ncbi:N-terminal EF-hand calcium-binding protein 1-like [Dysidea avara]|uniref:N-terminal EF-hand calcium-binding protein 1-like n=1 Tax=Dysidea avara TaxID=196820 RepID=UPI003320C6C0
MAESDHHALKAKDIVEDIFRRADKNDSGSLSLKEFQEFFSDGIMTSEELEELFHLIDTEKTNTLSPSELFAYFQQYMADFEPIFSLTDDLSVAITNTLKSTHNKHQSTMTKIEKFSTRFLIKEALEHVSVASKPLESANDHLTEIGLNECSANHLPIVVDTADTKAKVKWHKKYQRLVSGESAVAASGGVVYSDQFGSEMDRLSTLIDKLEGKIKLEVVEEEEVSQDSKNTIVVVRMFLEASESNVSAFRQSLKNYVQSVTSESGCLHVCVQSNVGSYRFSVYEVWQDSEHLSIHYASHASKVFRKNNVDHLVKPAVVNTMELPASWWPADI